MHRFIYISLHMHVQTYMYTFMGPYAITKYVNTCVHVYMYLYIYIYIYIYLFISLSVYRSFAIWLWALALCRIRGGYV